jgi:hypothetical protein
MLEVKGHVNSAYQILEKYGEKARMGRMSTDKAQKLAKKEISKLRYNEYDYFFIFNTKLIMVLHPIKPDLEGKDLSSFRDPSGNYIFRSFLSSANDGTGFSTYSWPKPGLSYPVEKIVYSKLYKPWSWIISSSTYTKQSENIIGQKQFIEVVSLIELYKIQVGKYPGNLCDLERFGSWVNGLTDLVIYEKVSDGYNLFFNVEEKLLSVTLPSELRQGLGIVNTNVKFSPKGSVKTIQ